MKNEILNKIHFGDWIKNEIPSKSIDLIFADPPYFEVKGDFDFEFNSFDEYLQLVELWAKECKRVLKDNGTVLWWGDSKKIAYSQIIFDKYFNLINSMVWQKTDSIQYQYYSINRARRFTSHNERLLVYEQEKIDLTDCVFHIRDYIRQEIKKTHNKIVLKDINKAMQTATNGGGVASACFSLKQGTPTMITKELYVKLQKWCYPNLRKEYEDLRKEYEDLRKEYEENRRPFNNKLKLEEVLTYSQQAHITKQYKHETKKPEQLTRDLINVCSNPGDLVLVPFAGSGTECAMAARSKRNFIGFDINKNYVDMSTARCKVIFKTPTFF
jgi:site-specific DNA-methyltransferase (adenine-specific)